ncbi:protein Z-dependent protease inhibitor-like [Thalassophryne amazonica]|uniref:protein Z-dependent protease inhibitor-like n=1 Tax=Thalassophryne amazonica TaxID=390379 RepID=UPI001470BF49|nr:protein Z-dependent protease inhibitor-like [Thalassophryne amazonica]
MTPPLWILVVLILQNPPAAQADVQDLTNRNADFAARLYRAVASRSDDNVFLSPLTLSVGLSALMSAADGLTRLQLLQGLEFSGLDPETVPDLFQSLRTSVTQQGGASSLLQGVAIFPANNLQVSSAYLDLVRDKYGGTIQSLDYTTPQDAIDAITRWSLEQTGDKIQNLATNLDTQTQLLLVTVAYYQAQFALSFNASLTQDERFYIDKYHVVVVPMMFRAGKYFLAYDWSLKVGVLKLPMTDGAAMLVVLPDENVDITTVEEDVSSEKVRAWIRQLKKTKLEVQIPRFLLERSLSLRGIMEAFNITHVFQDDASLINLGGTKGPRVTQVFHKAVITVDEKGNGEGRVSVIGSPPPRLTINRPFLFLVYQEVGGGVLLMGRVVDPSRK